jgi:hypothetical protein
LSGQGVVVGTAVGEVFVDVVEVVDVGIVVVVVNVIVEVVVVDVGVVVVVVVVVVVGVGENIIDVETVPEGVIVVEGVLEVVVKMELVVLQLTLDNTNNAISNNEIIGRYLRISVYDSKQKAESH